MEQLERSLFSLKVNEPFRLDLTAWGLRRRSHNSMDRWVDGSWRRALAVGDNTVEIIVKQRAQEASSIQVELLGLRLESRYTKLVSKILEKCLGINKDLSDFYAFAGKDKFLEPLVKRFLGLKPPRFPTVFEGVVNGIACQQLSLNLGITLLNRLCASYGRSIKYIDNISYAFPCPEDLAKLSVDNFRELGYSRQKGRAIIELSQAIVLGQLDLEQLENMNNTQALEQLCRLRGVGRWTGEYVLLRGLGRLDVFPGDDVGARKGLQRWLSIDKSLDYAQTKNIVSRWNPYGGLIYFYLLMQRLVQEGYLQA